MTAADERDLVFVGDAHLEAGDPEVERFVALVRSLAGRVGAIVAVGDLFNLWVGRSEFEGAHHRAVLDAFAAARSRGTAVHYVEGNRDYRIGPAHAGRELDRVGTDGLRLEHGPRRVAAVHGDLANAADLQYRTWRRVSRSAPLWWALNAVPGGRRLALAEWAERRMRSTNRRFKRRFPEEAVRRYAAGWHRAGCDLVVLGHFHEERVLRSGDRSGDDEAVVLPLWTDDHRHLRLKIDGTWSFETDSG